MRVNFSNNFVVQLAVSINDACCKTIAIIMEVDCLLPFQIVDDCLGMNV